MDENTVTKTAPKILTREEILSKTKLRAELVTVAEWGGTVRVRELTGAERDQYEASLVKMQKGNASADLTMDNARARLVALATIGDDGRSLFSDADVIALGKLSAAALSRVFDVAARLSKITASDIEELAGN